MKATTPNVLVPGDNEELVYKGTDLCVRPNIMARSGTCVGMNKELAVWRFGIMSDSEKGRAYGVYIPEDDKEYGFLWVIATRKTGKVKETFRGYALELPKQFGAIMDWEP